MDDKITKLIRSLMSVVQVEGPFHGVKQFNDHKWRLGDLLLATDGLKHHKRLRSIGDKTFLQLREEILKSEDLQIVIEQLDIEV